MTAPAAYAPVEESYTGVHGERHIELTMVAGCLSCIGHPYRMVGHVAPPSHFLSAALIFSGYHSGYVIVATEARKGFEIDTAGGLSVIFGRTLAFINAQMSFGRKLPV
jgi:hypothetical protein